MRSLLICSLFLCCFALSSVFARTWTAKSGHTMEGEFVKLEGDSVHISLANGRPAKIKLEQLSEADQEYAKQAGTGDNPFEIGEAPASAPKQQDLAQSVTLTIEGIGSTFEDAKKDAFRNAVNEVVGTIVDAETRVTQENVLEQTLTASNAYIERNKVLSQAQKGGLWHVKMEATVQKKALQVRLAPTASKVNEIDGMSIADRYATKTGAEDEKVLLLAKLLRDQSFPYSILEASAEMLPDPVKKEGDSLVMQFYVTIKPNVQKFDEFRKAVEPVLEKIALSKTTTNLKSKLGYDKKYYIENPPRNRIDFTDANGTVFLHLNSARNTSLESTRWNSYEFPHRAALVFASYETLLPVIDLTLHSADGEIIIANRVGNCSHHHRISNTSFFWPHNSAVQFLSLPDQNVIEISPHVSMGSNCTWALNFIEQLPNTKYSQFFSQSRDLFLAPFFSKPKLRLERYNGEIGFTPEFCTSTTITLEPAELKSVKSVKCRVMSENPSMDKYYEQLPAILKAWNPL